MQPRQKSTHERHPIRRKLENKNVASTKVENNEQNNALPSHPSCIINAASATQSYQNTELEYG